ncbi:MAG: hypothetical protein A3F10_03105 [Coxiella sp. RIFCSPHIGHO2_12_FULL_42_15]|nr:MAG: hypothetical protein A3F10_03105 [Coxiella sp. RIFCSPHIGHO2_12_FULL_42_15]
MKKTRAVVAIIAMLIALLFYVIIHFKDQRQHTSDLPTRSPPNDGLQYDLNIANQTVKDEWHMVTIKPGDTLRSLFVAQHIPLADLWSLTKSHHTRLNVLHPGEHIYYKQDTEHHLLAIRLPLSLEKELLITKNQQHYVEKIISLPTQTNIVYSSGTIRNSLANATKAAGLSSHMYSQLMAIFQGKVNFAHDLRKGDQFFLLYKRYTVNGKSLNRNEIVAAKLATQKQNYYAIKFSYPQNHTGYFTPKGRSIESRFLDFPIHYRRISSRFSYGRYDPILHAIRPHLGVDFAARAGTPIRSVGDGKITFIGHERGYGNAIKIRYDSHYSALYGHMNHFSPSVKLSAYVHKGDIIGYVGSTGWSTGPHLHFSFYKNGQPKDWLAMTRLSGNLIPDRYRKQFKETASKLLATLEIHATELAANNTHLMNNTR